MPTLPRPYSRYASIYDATGQTSFSLSAWRRTRPWLEAIGWTGQTVLELACGTGALARQMAAEGLRVIAIDLSREMLLTAREPAEARSVGWLQSDARAMAAADQSFDLVTSFYDSMNYLLTPADLEQVLAEVARLLRPGGCFLFDLNTPHALRRHWDGLCDASADEEVATIWIARWEEERQVSSLQATFFVRGADGRYDRFDEIHDERGYTERELRRAFRAAGLRLVRSEDWHTAREPSPTSRRVFYLLQR